MMHKARWSIEEAPELGVSGLQLDFEFINGFGKKHNVWCSTEKVS